MCPIKIDSRLISTPTEVLALFVIYETNATLSAWDADLNVLATDVNDNLPWSICDGMDGRLWERLSRCKGGSKSN